MESFWEVPTHLDIMNLGKNWAQMDFSCLSLLSWNEGAEKPCVSMKMLVCKLTWVTKTNEKKHKCRKTPSFPIIYIFGNKNLC